MSYLYLLLSIITEVIGSSFLKTTDGFSKIYPTIATFISFAACFYFLSKTLQYLPLNITYATWAGLGLILTTLVSIFIFKESINTMTVLSIGVILIGVISLNIFGSSH